MSALVGVIMGSKSDWSTLSHTVEMLDKLGIPNEVKVVSAHRTPDLLFQYAEQAESRGIQVIIAGAGDDHLDTARLGLFGVLEQQIRGAVGGDHLHFVGDAQLVQHLDGVAEGGPVGLGAHDHAYQCAHHHASSRAPGGARQKPTSHADGAWLGVFVEPADVAGFRGGAVYRKATPDEHPR